MPVIDCMGTAVRKMSQALHARHLWKPFKVHLVPAPGGIERCPQEWLIGAVGGQRTSGTRLLNQVAYLSELSFF